MKTIFLLLLTLVVSTKVSAQDSVTNSRFHTRDSLSISGDIIGYQPNQENHFITFSSYDLNGVATNQAVQIEDNGHFFIRLFQPFSGDIQLNYKDTYLHLFAQPKAHLSLKIYDDKVDREKFQDAFKAEGPLAEVNNLIFKFQTAFREHSFKMDADLGDKTQTDSVFAVRMKLKLKEQLDFLADFNAAQKVKNQQFISWQRNQLIYEIGHLILFYPFAGKLNKTINPHQLLQLVEGIPINNLSALHNSAYYRFLNILCGDHEIMININPLYEAEKAKSGNSTARLLLDAIDKFADGLIKQIAYAKVYHAKSGTTLDPSLLVRFQSTVEDPFLKSQLLSSTPDPFKTFNVIGRLQQLKVKPELKNRLITIFLAYKDTGLLIDFWGDWCGPCMSELPNYPTLIKALAGQKIKFLFLSVFTTEKSMLAIKEEHKIDGEFINLNKDEVSILNNVFNFHSYPSHFLVNNKGEVVQAMSRVGAGSTQQIKKLLFSNDEK